MRIAKQRVSLGAVILAGHGPVPVRSSSSPQEPLSKPTARSAWTTGTQRDNTALDPGAICTGMSPSDGGKQQATTLTVRPAGLRERERLDTRAVYLDQRCFPISPAGSVDHARVELRNPGSGRSASNTPSSCRNGARPPQWSPPLIGGSTRGKRPECQHLAAAAMEPAVDRREHHHRPPRHADRMDAAMEPAVDRREHQQDLPTLPPRNWPHWSPPLIGGSTCSPRSSPAARTASRNGARR